MFIGVLEQDTGSMQGTPGFLIDGTSVDKLSGKDFQRPQLQVCLMILKFVLLHRQSWNLENNSSFHFPDVY